jgi:ribosome maturation factor RimP
MTFKQKVEELLNAALEEKQYLFLVEFSISDSNKINIIIDGDQGVTLQDCIDVSRAVEHNLDREENDFSLEVASAGVGSLLKNIRQYKKNIGRNLKVKIIDGETLEGLLSDANDEKITLKWTSREPKKIGKGKETVENSKEIEYSNIKEAIVIIIF